MNNHEFIAGLPKAELHLHIEGTFEPELMFEIAQRNQIDLPYDSVQELRKAYSFNRLQDFLDIYYQGMNVLRKEQDYFDLTWAYLQQVSKQGVKHVEIFFDPQGHTDRGIPLATVINGIHNALAQGQAELGISFGIILCFLRHLPEQEAIATLEAAMAHKDLFIGVGLDSSEKGNPPEKFAQVFALARQAGLHCVAHAGEEGPAAYVRSALDVLKVERVDHGNTALDDPELVARLVSEQVPLTVCPLSNQKLCVVPDLRLHPIKIMLEAGLCATVNSDDPAYFGGYINANFQALDAALDLSREDLQQLAENSFRAAFITDDEKQRHIANIRQYAQGFGA